MPNDVRVNVCVAAFTHAEFATELIRNHILPDLIDELSGNTGYDLTAINRVYSEDRDSWSPFKDGIILKQYFTACGYKPTYLSSYIERSEGEVSRFSSLISNVDLYVFDPVFVACDIWGTLVSNFQGAIYQGKKNFCLIMPDRLSSKAKELLTVICQEKLPLLQLSTNEEGRGVWVAENAIRFTQYLTRDDVRKESEPAPDRGRLADLAELVSEPTPKVTPRLFEGILEPKTNQ